MKIYSLHTITDGKWQVTLTIRENDDYKYKYESRPDLREIIDRNYNCEPEALAKIVLETVMSCEAVQVNLLCGPGIYMERK